MTVNYLGIKTPAAGEAAALKGQYLLANHGLQNLNAVYWNLSVPALYEEALFRREGRIAHMGPFVASTGSDAAGRSEGRKSERPRYDDGRWSDDDVKQRRSGEADCENQYRE